MIRPALAGDFRIDDHPGQQLDSVAVMQGVGQRDPTTEAGHANRIVLPRQAIFIWRCTDRPIVNQARHPAQGQSLPDGRAVINLQCDAPGRLDPDPDHFDRQSPCR